MSNAISLISGIALLLLPIGLVLLLPKPTRRWGKYIAIASFVIVTSKLTWIGIDQETNTFEQGFQNRSYLSTAKTMWVISDRLRRRTCPSTPCGIVGVFFKNEKLEVLEEQNGWVRISNYYDASCRNGHSEYIDDGNKACVESNGISNENMAEWVSSDYISQAEPEDPAETATISEQLIRLSDDFSQYRVPFLEAATSLIEAGACTEHDFVENGGWVKSSTHSGRPVYFMYCGTATIANRLYLNAASGEIFQ